MEIQIKSGKIKIQSKDFLVRARIPERFWKVKLNLIPESPYKDTLNNYIENFEDFYTRGVGLFIYSKDNSCGKTSAGVILLKAGISKGLTCLFAGSDEVMDSKVRKIRFDEDEDLISRMHRVNILLIDDIDKEYRGTSGFSENQLEALIRKRSQQLKVTIVTSNRTPAEIKEIYSSALSELMKECMYPLKIPGQSEGGKNWRAEEARFLAEKLRVPPKDY